ncbi:MAG: proline--tRNA ligase [Rickettsia sp.]|nr:proline--tRNA ligase [Rickettsia sp.]
MLLSEYFIPVLKENPKEAEIKSHNLMIKSGMISQHVSGIYHWLPLGVRVIDKITNIIRKHLAKNNILEITTPYLQNAALWRSSNRYDSYGKEMMKLQDRHGQELILGPTNEEVITDIAKKFFLSYKNLPKILYQIQWKFRDEIRPRFGVLRGREFLMKDAYSFDYDFESSMITYSKIFQIYNEIFDEMGLNIIAAEADSSEIGGKVSHEFHILSDIGESEIYFDKNILDLKIDQKKYLDFYSSFYSKTSELGKTEENKKEFFHSKSIEVGQIFNFDTKYSKKMDAKFTNKEGHNSHFFMGSYGIGISRLVAAAIEENSDENSITWPKKLSPFQVSLINLEQNNSRVVEISDNLYKMLQSYNIEVLYDDSLKQAGYKLKFHHLIGFPLQIIVSSKLISKNYVECIFKRENISHKIEIGNFEKFIKSNLNDLVKI